VVHQNNEFDLFGAARGRFDPKFKSEKTADAAIITQAAVRYWRRMLLRRRGQLIKRTER
jgi:hypothetical protein